jgi:hypothetical protein
MIQTTPAPDRSTRFACPNPRCVWCNQPGEGTITPRSWTGPHQQIARLRCTACAQACSAREGTVMARRKRPEDTLVRLLQCQRWGVCDAGTAARWAVALTTVQRLQRVAAQRAATHHRQSVPHGDGEGVPWDEAPATRRPQQGAWVQTAWAMGSWWLLGGDCGPRTQETAAALIAQVVARARQLPLVLTAGWKAYSVALLQVGGVVDRPRRRGHVGRKPQPRLVAPKSLWYARWSRAAPRRATSWRSGGGWGRVARAVCASRCAYGRAGSPSRQPVGNGGLVPSEGWWPPYAAAPGVGRGAAPAPGGRSGGWSVSTMA